MNTVKKHVGHGITQFGVTKEVVNNLQQFKISPVAKLVLIYLTTCFNPTKPFMFPKQKTMAAILGVSERSIVRAISELVKAGVILVEVSFTNRYRFTSKIVQNCPQIDSIVAVQEITPPNEVTNCPPKNEKIFSSEKLSDNKRQNSANGVTNCPPSCHEQRKEHEVEQSKRVKEINSISETIKIDEYKLLKKYAMSKGAKNVQKYVNALIINGSAKEIIKAHKEKLAIEEYHRREIQRTQELIAKQREDFDKAVKPTECDAIRKVLSEKFGRKFA